MASSFASAEGAMNHWIAGPVALLDEIRRSASGVAWSEPFRVCRRLQLLRKGGVSGEPRMVQVKFRE
ncbi:hypothetical protein ABID19_005705 [Mesorhizobium robiniae]|uniref:Uncharacterized protein n=1 Tax=Mesorhizobium robiniae TaxID=559315 RepID=A0ABV2GWH2_9HYPH